MYITDHAYDEMLQAEIDEYDVEQCLRYGSIEIGEWVKGEFRFGKKLITKNKKFIVIYALRAGEERVITVYKIGRKRKW